MRALRGYAPRARYQKVQHPLTEPSLDLHPPRWGGRFHDWYLHRRVKFIAKAIAGSTLLSSDSESFRLHVAHARSVK